MVVPGLSLESERDQDDLRLHRFELIDQPG